MEQLTFELSACDSTPATCACGCGSPTTIATRTSTRDGTVKGQPVRYAVGHGHKTRRRDVNGRECCRCGEYKPWDDYYADRGAPNGHSVICKACAQAKNRAKATGVGSGAKPRGRVDDQGRECTKCGTYKPWEDFDAARSGFRGHDSMCKACKADRSRVEWEAAKAARAADDRPAASSGCMESNGQYTSVIPLQYGSYVYRCWTADDQCIYVGRTKHVLRRFAAHALLAWWKDVHHVDVAVMAGPQEADAEEIVQIRHWRPVNNSHYNRTYGRKSTKPPPTHCPYDHEYTPENTIYNLKGSKICRECKNAKARAATPKKGMARGERAGSAKLTGAAVADMRRRAARGEPTTSIARSYGIAWNTANNAIKGKTWVHVLGGSNEPEMSLRL